MFLAQRDAQSRNDLVEDQSMRHSVSSRCLGARRCRRGAWLGGIWQTRLGGCEGGGGSESPSSPVARRRKRAKCQSSFPRLPRMATRCLCPWRSMCRWLPITTSVTSRRRRWQSKSWRRDVPFLADVRARQRPRRVSASPRRRHHCRGEDKQRRILHEPEAGEGHIGGCGG